ncbi:MAG: TolC family protein [Campylobacterota bacterium]|nr:TolC family protein [Campylobacterota bacterium]
MISKLLFLFIPIFIYGDSLQELLEYSNKNNDLITSKNLTKKSKSLELESAKSASYPTLDVGAFYQSLEEKTLMMSGDTYSGYAKISYDIYDGGKKSSTIKQKQNELESTSFDVTSFEKNLALLLVQDFFSIKNHDASLLALEEKKVTLKAQLERVKKFYEAGLATKDEVDKLQSASDTNIYNIESLKFQRLRVKQSLELKVGKEIFNLEDASFVKNLDMSIELDDATKSLQEKANSLQNQANSLKSVYLPQVNISDTYSIYGYSRTDAMHPSGVDNQNKLMLSLNLRLFDGGSVEKNIQAIMTNKNSLKTEIKYKTKEQKMLFDVAKSKIVTTKLKIKSAKSALVSAKGVYSTIERKYKAGLVDNIAYLDALSVKINAISLYKSSLNDLEVAYAIYYFYAGKNIEEFIK